MALQQTKTRTNQVVSFTSVSKLAAIFPSVLGLAAANQTHFPESNELPSELACLPVSEALPVNPVSDPHPR